MLHARRELSADAVVLGAGGSGLEKEDLVPLRHVQDAAQLGLGLLKDLKKDLRAVTHLHH